MKSELILRVLPEGSLNSREGPLNHQPEVRSGNPVGRRIPLKATAQEPVRGTSNENKVSADNDMQLLSY